jgi:ankyrin repeat protein
MTDTFSDSLSREQQYFFNAICSFPTKTPSKKASSKRAESVMRRRLTIIQNFLEYHDPNFARNGESPLSKAALLPETLVLEQLLESDKVKVNWSSARNGRTALSWAAEYCRTASVNALLNKGSDCHLKDKNGRTALSWAATPNDSQKANTEVIECLLCRGSCLNSEDNSLKTPLSWAVSENCMNTVVGLLNHHDVQVDRPDISGRTPLSLAASSGQIDIKRHLVGNGASVQSKDKVRRTPLSWAGTDKHKNANDKVIEFLLNKGSEINAEDSCKKTPLSWAVSERCLGAVHVLLKNDKIQVDRPDVNGQTPFLLAARSGNVELMIRLLKSKKVDVSQNVENQKSFELLLKTRYTFVSSNSEDMDKSILSELIFQLPETLNGRTLMSWTAEYDDIEIAKLLLRKENTRIDDGEDKYTTSLIRASEHKSLNLMILLVPRDKISLSLLVKEASRFGERKALNLLRVLLEHHYDANHIDDDGNTPLHLACYNDNPEFVSALIPATNQINSPNHDDKTPMQIALDSKNTCAIKLLFEKGVDFSPEECSDLSDLESGRNSYVQLTTGKHHRSLCWGPFAKNWLEWVPNLGESRLWYVLVDYQQQMCLIIFLASTQNTWLGPIPRVISASLIARSL